MKISIIVKKIALLSSLCCTCSIVLATNNSNNRLSSTAQTTNPTANSQVKALQQLKKPETTYVYYILAKSNGGSDRYITRLCVYSVDAYAKDKKPHYHWQLFYKSSGENSKMPDTVLPFYGFSSRGPMFKKPPCYIDDANYYYERNFVAQIANLHQSDPDIDWIKEDWIDTMNSFAKKNDYNTFKALLGNTSLPYAEYTCRLDNIYHALVSSQFQSGIWKNEGEQSAIDLAEALKSSEAFSIQETKPEFVSYKFIVSDPQESIELRNDNIEENNKIINNFFGTSYFVETKCD